MRSAATIALLVIVATVQGFAPAAGCRGVVRQQIVLQPRTPAPRALLVPETTAASLALPTAALLAAEDVFGEVFMAGMSIAFAAIGATVFVGILVRGKYDDIEQSFFDAQDDMVDDDKQLDSVKSQAVSDFFGDINPTEAPANDGKSS